jgi:hypothetical protein
MIRKTVIYLDNSTLSHMVTAIARDDKTSPWIALHDALRVAAHRNVICCPGSPVIDHESQFSSRVSRAVREMSRALGDVRLHFPSTVQDNQLLRAFQRFLCNAPPQTEHAPPFSDVSDDKPHDWLPFVQFSSLIHVPPDELDSRRESKESQRENVTEIFKRYVSEGLTTDEIRIREARGVGSALFKVGPLWPFLHIARKRFDESTAWDATKRFLMSDYAAMIPAADITSRMYAAVAAAFSAGSHRLPKSGDADDIQQIGAYLPYVDVLVVDRFFAHVSSEMASDLDAYQGRIRRLGPKQIEEFINWLNSLVNEADHAPLSARIYEEVGQHGSFRKFTDRIGLSHS